MFGDILMNRVVGEARERVRDHADFDFGLIGVAEFENLLRNAPHFGVGEQVQRCNRRAGLASRGGMRILVGVSCVLSHKSSGRIPVAQASACVVLNLRTQKAHRLKPVLLKAHYLANAAPSFTLRKRAGDAPCPVPMVCMGWPLPQLGVPQSVQCSREQMASQLFQNSVVMPL